MKAELETTVAFVEIRALDEAIAGIEADIRGTEGQNYSVSYRAGMEVCLTTLKAMRKRWSDGAGSAT